MRGLAIPEHGTFWNYFFLNLVRRWPKRNNIYLLQRSLAPQNMLSKVKALLTKVNFPCVTFVLRRSYLIALDLVAHKHKNVQAN